MTTPLRDYLLKIDVIHGLVTVKYARPVQNNYDWNRIVGTISTFVMTINTSFFQPKMAFKDAL